MTKRTPRPVRAFAGLLLALAGAAALAAPPTIAVGEFDADKVSAAGAIAELRKIETVATLETAIPGGLDQQGMDEAAKLRGANYVLWAPGEQFPLVLQDMATGAIVAELEPGDDPAALAKTVAEKALERDAWLDERPEENEPRIVVRWQIESATDNFGYIVYRAEAATEEGQEEEFKPITRGILPGVGTTSEPQVMRYVDKKVEMEKVYAYKVEEVGLSGAKVWVSDPNTNQVMTLRGVAKRLSRREAAKYGAELYFVEQINR